MGANVAAWSRCRSSIGLSEGDVCPIATRHDKLFFARTLNCSIGAFAFQRRIGYSPSQELYLWLSRTSVHMFEHLSIKVTFCGVFFLKHFFIFIFVLGWWQYGICLNTHLKTWTGLLFCSGFLKCVLYARILPSRHFSRCSELLTGARIYLPVVLCHWLWFV